MIERPPDLERLRSMLAYDQQTGIFKWKVGPSNIIKAGSVAGAPEKYGYIKIRVCGVKYLAHRLAWFYVTGDWPDQHIDHINGKANDNRIENLRLATRSQNLANSRRRRDNVSGFKGVSFYKQTKRWVAHIGKNGRRITIGYFLTPEEAHAAYCTTARRLFGEFARAG